MSNYHYTKAVHLANIVNDGEIRTTIITSDKKERPAVWLTRSEEWEVCCSGNRVDKDGRFKSRLTLKEMRETLGICRIKINESLPTTSWAKFKYVGNISDSLYESFNDFSIKTGNKTQMWNCSFKPITSEYFDSIEMLVEDDWVTWDGSISIEEFVDICHSCNANGGFPEFVYSTKESTAEGTFLKENLMKIMETWAKDCVGRNGCLEMFVDEDYESCTINFNESDFEESDFTYIPKKNDLEYMYLNMFWKASLTQYKIAIPFFPELVNMMIMR